MAVKITKLKKGELAKLLRASRPDPTMVRYFAYGSNMDPQQMKERCPSAVPIGHMILPNYRLVFDVPCRFIYGCAANIRPDDTQITHGVLWAISRRDFKILDSREINYRRTLTTVFSYTGTPMAAYVYIRWGAGREEPPDARYMDRLLAGADHFNLPQRYLEWLQNHKMQY